MAYTIEFDNDVRRLQVKLLDIFKEFHNVCENNNLKYYMVGGTLLGAIRHQGFIPWDDDIDIAMPREDYDKLLALPVSAWPENLIVKHAFNDDDYICGYTKIIDKNTTLVENIGRDLVRGVFIDVFPLDGAGNKPYQAKLAYYFCWFYNSLLIYSQTPGNRNNYLKRIFRIYAKNKDPRKIFCKLDKHMRKHRYYDSTIVGNFTGVYHFKEFVSKSIFGVPKLYKFEQYMFYGPNDAKTYLTHIYGDFMKMPPLEKRKSHHSFIYIDLNKPFEKYKNEKE